MKTSAGLRNAEPRPRGPRAENRQNILDMSLDLFAARGFDGVSIRDISEAANVHGATIYHYFGDKQALYEQTQRIAIERQLVDHLAILEGPGDARARLHGFLSNMLRSMIYADAKRQLIERMYSEPDDRPAPFENGPLQARFQESLQQIIRDLVPGAGAVYWGEVSGIINGIPHGMMRSRQVHERAGVALKPLDPDLMAELLTDIVVAAFEVVVRRDQRAAGGRP